MNGSVTPNVMGSTPDGSGLLAMSRSRWFCQKHSPQATTSTATETMILVRSSSRCSTSVSRSSCFAALSRATGLAAILGYDLALNRLGGLVRALDLGRLRLFVVVVVVLAR